MTAMKEYVSPEIVTIEIKNADVVTDSSVNTPTVTFPWQKTPDQTPGSEL